jgi:hypothetical protein
MLQGEWEQLWTDKEQRAMLVTPQLLDGEMPVAEMLTREKVEDQERETQTVRVQMKGVRRRHLEPTCTEAQWHHRLAHAGRKQLHNPHLGLKFSPGKEIHCEACETANARRTPMTGGVERWFVMSEERNAQAERCFNMDIGGPYVQSRNGGFTYVLVLSSPCGFIFTHFMKTRTTANVCAGLMRLMCLLPPGQIMKLQSDHAAEFTSAEFEALCQLNDIDHRTVARDSPELNGGAERALQTLKRLTASVSVAAGVGTT